MSVDKYQMVWLPLPFFLVILVGWICKSCEIWSGSNRSPANRSVANVLMASECSDFIVDVAKPLAVFVRDRAVIVYEHPIRGTKVVRRLDLVDRSSQLPPLDAKLIANGPGRVSSQLVPDEASHLGACSVFVDIR